jgi:hypothetical protein
VTDAIRDHTVDLNQQHDGSICSPDWPIFCGGCKCGSDDGHSRSEDQGDASCLFLATTVWSSTHE